MRSVRDLWPVRGPKQPTAPRCGPDSDLVRLVDLGFLVGAGERVQPQDIRMGSVKT
jgi:hypothetical protein